MLKDYYLGKILHILTNNSRTTTKNISKETKYTQQNISSKLSNLKKNNIITSYKLLVDSSKFGFNNFCVLIRLKHTSKQFLKTLSTELKKIDEITCIDFLFGNYDIFLRFTTPNTSYFNKILREILTKYSKEVMDHVILTQIVLYYYPSNYLSKITFKEKDIISGDREIVNLDNTNKEILNILNEDASTNFAHIAKKLDTTSKTIISRVKNLEKRNIIKGYSINIDHEKLNINRYFLFLKFNFNEEQFKNPITKFALNHPNIIELIKVFGNWDSILIIETTKPGEFKEIISDIKEKFADEISSYNFLESQKTTMWKYLPQLEIK